MYNLKFEISYPDRSQVVQTMEECMDFVAMFNGLNETAQALWEGQVGNKANFPPGCFVLCWSSDLPTDCFGEEAWKAKNQVMFNSILDPSLTTPDTFPTNAAGIKKTCN